MFASHLFCYSFFLCLPTTLVTCFVLKKCGEMRYCRDNLTGSKRCDKILTWNFSHENFWLVTPKIISVCFGSAQIFDTISFRQNGQENSTLWRHCTVKCQVLGLARFCVLTDKTVLFSINLFISSFDSIAETTMDFGLTFIMRLRWQVQGSTLISIRSSARCSKNPTH